MKYMVEDNFVNVIGYIWMPSNVICAQQIKLQKSDVENIGAFTRENVDQWLASHAGDFSHIIDFEATIGDEWIHWKDEESECKYLDCTEGE